MGALGVTLADRQMCFAVSERRLAIIAIATTIDMNVPRAVRDERAYEREDVRALWESSYATALPAQRALLDELRRRLDNNIGGLVFADALGGIGVLLRPSMCCCLMPSCRPARPVSPPTHTRTPTRPSFPSRRQDVLFQRHLGVCALEWWYRARVSL